MPDLGRQKVMDYVMRLIDYGRGAPDDELDGMTIGEIAEVIIDAAKTEQTCPEDTIVTGRVNGED